MWPKRIVGSDLGWVSATAVTLIANAKFDSPGRRLGARVSDR